VASDTTVTITTHERASSLIRGAPIFCEAARRTRPPARPPPPTYWVTAMCRRIESDTSIRIDFLAWIESNRIEVIFGESECSRCYPIILHLFFYIHVCYYCNSCDLSTAISYFVFHFITLLSWYDVVVLKLESQKLLKSRTWLLANAWEIKAAGVRVSDGPQCAYLTPNVRHFTGPTLYSRQ